MFEFTGVWITTHFCLFFYFFVVKRKAPILQTVSGTAATLRTSRTQKAFSLDVKLSVNCQSLLV